MSHPPIVLIVEDDDSNREMYSAYLESAGYGVLGARNGMEGLTEARRHHPNVVVTDITMPGMNGWDLARALRQDAKTTNIGIIAVSGRSPDEIGERGLAAHFDVVLTKPCLPDELLREIRLLVARSRLSRLKANEQLAKAARLRARSEVLLERSKTQTRQRRRK